jgi:hypothetical protein
MEAPRKLARRPAHFAQNLAKNVRLRVGMAVALTVGNADDDHR